MKKLNGAYLCLADLTFHQEGVPKKVIAQIEALKKYSNIKKFFFIKENFLYNYENKLIKSDGILKKYKIYREVLKQLNNKELDFIYIRYSGFKLLEKYFFKKIKQQNKHIKILVEIPTYPYFNEIQTLKGKIGYYLQKLIEKNVVKNVDKIITFSNHKKIKGKSCINIKNGVDLNKISVVKKIKNTELIRFTSVSTYLFWHGMDRFLVSLEKSKIDNFNLTIVGNGPEIKKLKEITNKSEKLKNKIIFAGLKTGQELDEIYNQTDIAIGSLGRHRSGLSTMRALKNREYCAKGLPMIFSEDDPDLREAFFVHKVSADEELIDINRLIEWYKKINQSSEQIRAYAKQFSWDIQMKIVVDELQC